MSTRVEGDTWWTASAILAARVLNAPHDLHASMATTTDRAPCPLPKLAEFFEEDDDDDDDDAAAAAAAEDDGGAFLGAAGRRLRGVGAVGLDCGWTAECGAALLELAVPRLG